MAEVQAGQSTDKKRRPVAMPAQWGLAEEKRRDHVVEVALGITQEDILEPSFWSHLAPEFNALDKIEVRAEDGSWIANLRVIHAERNYAKVIMEGPIFQIGEPVELANVSTRHRVEWKGPVMLYTVIRLSDSEPVRTKCKTREEAAAWMIEHEKATRT